MALSQSISYGGFKYVEDISMFKPDLIINYNKNIDALDVDYPEYLQPLHKDFPSFT